MKKNRQLGLGVTSWKDLQCSPQAGVLCPKLALTKKTWMNPQKSSFHFRGHKTSMRDGQTSPHSPRLVVSRSTCPPLSSPPNANSFVLGPAVVKHTQKGATCVKIPGSSRVPAGWAPDPLMIGIRSPDGLVVGLAPATLEFWVRFPNERNQGKQGATLF